MRGLGVCLHRPLCRAVDIVYESIDGMIKKLLKDIFCGVGRNSPYGVNDFVRVLLDAVEHVDQPNRNILAQQI